MKTKEEESKELQLLIDKAVKKRIERENTHRWMFAKRARLYKEWNIELDMIVKYIKDV
jgi:hypothetical protein